MGYMAMGSGFFRLKFPPLSTTKVCKHQKLCFHWRLLLSWLFLSADAYDYGVMSHWSYNFVRLAQPWKASLWRRNGGRRCLRLGVLSFCPDRLIVITFARLYLGPPHLAFSTPFITFLLKSKIWVRKKWRWTINLVYDPTFFKSRIWR